MHGITPATKSMIFRFTIHFDPIILLTAAPRYVVAKLNFCKWPAPITFFALRRNLEYHIYAIGAPTSISCVLRTAGFSCFISPGLLSAKGIRLIRCFGGLRLIGERFMPLSTCRPCFAQSSSACDAARYRNPHRSCVGGNRRRYSRTPNRGEAALLCLVLLRCTNPQPCPSFSLSLFDCMCDRYLALILAVIGSFLASINLRTCLHRFLPLSVQHGSPTTAPQVSRGHFTV